MITKNDFVIVELFAQSIIANRYHIKEMTLTAPEPLASHHCCDDFSCGIASLDDWLKRRAYTNHYCSCYF